LLGDVRRKNIGRIGEELAEVDDQSVHNFVSESQWVYRALVNQVAKDANTLHGGNEESMLLLDETSFLKKDTHIVGVARQYGGCSGKIENGQVRYSEPSAAARMSPWTIITCICPRAGLRVKSD
jgi:SRSO17 transposase